MRRWIKAVLRDAEEFYGVRWYELLILALAAGAAAGILTAAARALL